jgi:hypothetical protein
MFCMFFRRTHSSTDAQAQAFVKTVSCKLLISVVQLRCIKATSCMHLANFLADFIDSYLEKYLSGHSLPHASVASPNWRRTRYNQMKVWQRLAKCTLQILAAQVSLCKCTRRFRPCLGHSLKVLAEAKLSSLPHYRSF